MAELFLPTLHTFAMNNPFTGSCGLFRFRAVPNVVMATPKEVDFAASSIYTLYSKGIVSGSDKQLTFRPEAVITRAHVAAMVARIARPEQRLSYS